MKRCLSTSQATRRGAGYPDRGRPDRVGTPECRTREAAKTSRSPPAAKQQVARALALLDSRLGQVLAAIIGEGQADPETLQSFNERFLLIRRAAARDLIERGKRSGEIAKGVDVELAIDLIYGPLYHRLLARHQPLNERFATDLVNWALRGLAPR